MSRPDRKSKAFTLLELIVTIVVLRVLAAIAVPTFAHVITKSQDSAATQTLRAVDREAKALAALDRRDVSEDDYAAAANDTSASGPGILAAGYTTSNVLPADRGRFGVKVTGTLAGVAMLSESGNCILLRSDDGNVSVHNRGALGDRCTGAAAQSGTAAVAHSTAILSAGPAAYYQMEDLSTSQPGTADSSPAARTALRSGGAGSYGPSSGAAFSSDFGDSAAFNGAGDHLQLPASAISYPTGFTGFSAEVWVNPTFPAGSTWQRIFDLGNGMAADNIIAARVGDTDMLRFSFYRGGAEYILQTAQGQGAIVPGVEAHYAFTLTPSGYATIYKNGTLLTQGQIGVPSTVTRNAMYVGRSHWSFDSYYTGRMDELAFFTRTLSAAEVAAHYSAR